MVEAELRGIQIVTSPYTIHFKRTPKYYKPGMSFDVTILSKGQLVKRGHGKVSDKLFSKMVLITKEMLPSFRIIAYFHTDDNEVVADSVWVDVKDSCMGSLKLEISKPSTVYSPSKTLYLKVTGDPEAKVGMVAVDKGCLRPKQQAPPHPEEGNFFISYLSLKISERASQYNDPLQRECCKDGMVDLPLSYSCEVRSEYIGDGAACVEAFLHCCKEMENQRAERRQDSLQLARSEEDDKNYMDSNEIVTRTKFPESWLWKDINLPACSQQIPNCRTTSVVEVVRLQDSITTWQFTGISLSRTHGICVGESLEVIVRKEFFIDLRLPYSAVRGEQLEVKAILHNYSPDKITVRVDLTEAEHVCSVASKHGRYRQEVKMGGLTTLSVPFIIIPMKDGQYPIEVKAAVKDSSLSDGIMKMLRVVPEGVLIKAPQTITLDPTKKGVDGVQKETLNSGIPKKDVVPNTPSSTRISVTGREQVAGLVENAISGNSMGTLIYQPSGCGEQTMIHTTLPVIATTYLDKTNQWETVGFQKRNEALQHIKTGYTRMLTFRKGDGSFAVYPTHQSSSWLTAYVAKVFAMASSLVAVQSNTICDAVKFLILKAQQPDGVFKEVGKVYHGEMIGDVRGTDSDASMTAFCLIAMQESRTLCAATVNSLPNSIDKAVAYLERRLPSLTNPYAVAVTSYALANEKKLNREILYRFASPALSHWPVPKGRVYTLEATAYALLALVRTKAYEDARPIVRWFTQQQKVGGGYGSTQATIMVYQAVAEYWANAREPEYDLNVDIQLPGRSKPDKYHFNKENSYGTRTSKMVSLYYALPKEKESDCQNFNLSVQLIPDKMDENEKIYKLKIEVLYKNKEHDATMSILDIGLLTGFTADTKDLDRLAKGRARTISKYEMDTALSERGSLIIYLDKVSHRRPEEITFRVRQTMKVGVLQPAAVSVYEYYEQTPCVKFYHPERRSGELMRLCRNDECTCAEENCSMQKKGNIDNRLRTEKSCETTPTSKIDFVYKVGLENFEDGLSTDIYTMRVLEVIKEGSYDVGPQGKLRTFLSYPHCRESLDLVKGKHYLIMGTSKDIHRDDENNSFQYVLGERTWIEYWPTNAECQIEEHRHTCVGLEEMQQQYALFGCGQ
ncbi:Complement C3 [Larimichthys crocea]|uniref:Uncharacterized protein n=1 Tax=Larimichthys crocea TaxID=215358 RepID=A0ACD3RTU2_LARCR|nr:Complement C3 [Larimichthys crocea]